MGCHMWAIVPGNSIRGGLAKAAPRKTTSPAIFQGRRDSRRWFRRWVPAIWLLALFAFAGGCGINLGSPPISSSDPADLAGTWVGTIEEDDGVVYETTAEFSANGDISFTIHREPDALDTVSNGTVGSLNGSDKLFSFTLDGTNEGGLVADDTFEHAGIIVKGFSAGVLQKTTDLDADRTPELPYSLSDIAGVVFDGDVTWIGSIMRVVIDDQTGAIKSVTAKSSTVTISYDGSFIGNNFDDEVIKNTGAGQFSDPNLFGRYIGIWELEDGSKIGPVVILITPDKEFLGSYSCVGTDPADRILDKCDFHLWHKQ